MQVPGRERRLRKPPRLHALGRRSASVNMGEEETEHAVREEHKEGSRNRVQADIGVVAHR